MPNMGIPQNLQRKNPFAKVGMAPRKNDIDADILEKVTGQRAVNGAGVKFVDRQAHNKMGKEEFLKLLSHQLKNQDPMNPMEQQKFTAELAQFSQLEQMTNMNKKLENMMGNANMEAKYMAASFIGKQVFTSGNTIDYTGQGSKELHFNLDKDAKGFMVRILDQNGDVIREMTKEGDFLKGPQNISWDGKQMDHYAAGKGVYSVSVTAWDENFQEVKAAAKSSGLVKGVSFDNGETVLSLDSGSKVLLRDVDRFEAAASNVEQKIPTGNALRKYGKMVNEYE